MSVTKYEYSVSRDILSGSVNLDQLDLDIKKSSVSDGYLGAEGNHIIVNLLYESDLDLDSKANLDLIILNHQPLLDDIPCFSTEVTVPMTVTSIKVLKTYIKVAHTIHYGLSGPHIVGIHLYAQLEGTISSFDLRLVTESGNTLYESREIPKSSNSLYLLRPENCFIKRTELLHVEIKKNNGKNNDVITLFSLKLLKL